MHKMIDLGKLGEEIICIYLKNTGHLIQHTNYHSRYGEIDIISEDDKYIVFVEVKTRKSFKFSRAIESVNKSKRIKIIKTAYCYLEENPTSKQPRFDIAEVLIDSYNKPHITYHENSFDVEECDAFF